MSWRLLRYIVVHGAHPEGPVPSLEQASVNVPGRAHALIIIAVLVLVAPTAWLFSRQVVAAERQAIAAVAELKARSLKSWFDERLASAGLSGTSFPQAELYTAWRQDGDEGARERLFLRLSQFALAGQFSDVTLHDEAGAQLWGAADRTYDSLELDLGARWPDGALVGEFALLGEHRDAAGSHPLGFATALPVGGGGPAPVVVYHSSRADLLSPELSSWTTARGPGDVSVFRLGELGLEGFQRDVRDGVLVNWSLPLHDDEALAARLVTGSDAPGTITTGTDHRGVRVVGAGHAIDETGWYLLAYAQRREVYAGVAPLLGGSLAVALLLYAGGALGTAAVGKRQRRAVARGIEAAQARELRSLRLLGALADASPDAIFAKDLEGRYLLFNRAASRVVGVPVEEVLGSDDRGLFPEEQVAVMRANDRAIVADGEMRVLEESVTTAAGERHHLSTKGALRDEEGRVIGTFGISRDITERIVAERALRRQAEVLAESVADLERTNRVMVGRELAMIELKRRVNEYARRLGEEAPYDLSAVGAIEDADG